MIGRWSNYRLRMQGIRQKYLTLMRKKINVQRVAIKKDIKGRIFRGILYTCGLGTIYYYGNQIFSQYHEMKQVKAKLFRDYPEQVCFIGIGQQSINIQAILEEETIASSENTAQQKEIDKKLTKSQNVKYKYILNLDQNEQTTRLKDQLGKNLTIFMPYDLDQLCNVVELCHKYRHKVLPGNYQVQLSDKFNQNDIIKALSRVPKPSQKDKYILIDISRMKKMKLDDINSIIELDVGWKCKQINKKLEENGYKALFPKFLEDQTLYDMITNNYPLNDSQSLSNMLLNLTLVSSSGVKFRSSTEIGAYGQIPNLTPLFIGTGGAFSIPAEAKIKIKKQIINGNNQHFEVQGSSKNQLILKLRRIRNYLDQRDIFYNISWGKEKLMLKINKSDKIDDTQKQSLGLKKITTNQIKQKLPYQMVFSTNNSIIEQLLLYSSSLNFTEQKGVLYLQLQQSSQQSCEPLPFEQKIHKFISTVSLGGGTLIWSRNGKKTLKQLLSKSQYHYLKNRLDLQETGAELMKKIVQIREGIDKRHILDSHQRFEKYYKKNLFRKMTEFFW